MSLLLGISILALAVIVGGLAAVFRTRAEGAMPAVRTFAVVAAASVALLHLLPEAIAEVGLWAVLATGVGLVGPVALERAFEKEPGHDHAHEAPTTALAMGYAAVVAHQAGEGAAVATLARTGGLTLSIVLAIAAHTVPLAMVVAIRVLEVRGTEAGAKRATGLALAGVALATVVGAFAGNLLGTARIAAVEPWILATIAGLLLHALAHDPAPATPGTPKARLADAAAGLVGLVIALAGVEEHGWTQHIPGPAQVAGVVLVAAAIVARSFRSHTHRGSHRH